MKKTVVAVVLVAVLFSSCDNGNDFKYEYKAGKYVDFMDNLFKNVDTEVDNLEYTADEYLKVITAEDTVFNEEYVKKTVEWANNIVKEFKDKYSDIQFGKKSYKKKIEGYETLALEVLNYFEVLSKEKEYMLLHLVVRTPEGVKHEVLTDILSEQPEKCERFLIITKKDFDEIYNN